MRNSWHLLAPILLLVFTSLSLSSNSQNSETSKSIHVWVYFTDKGDNIDEKLLIAEANFTANSIKRRRKHNPIGRIAVYNDIPVKLGYINEISKTTKIRVVSKWLNAVSVDVEKENITAISSLPFVKRISKIKQVKSLEIGNNTLPSFEYLNNSFHSQFLSNLDYGSSFDQLNQIGVPHIHELGYSGNGVTVCVLDAGFNNLEHETFAILDTLASYDFVNSDPNVDDQDSDEGVGNHGTMTLSSIAGFSEGELIGPAYGAQYILAKTENTASETLAEEDAWVQAMEWAEANYGIDVSSTSLGYVDFDDGTIYSADDLDGETSAISIASEAAAAIGILVVQSAGNSGQGSPTTIGTPADSDNTLTIGAVDSQGVISGFSSIGPTGDGRIKPELMAMGSAVYVADVTGNAYRNANGTSFSGPIAAGAATLLVEMAPDATNYEIIEALKMSASNSFAPDNYYGWGIINLPAAYDWLISPHITHEPLPNTMETQLPFIIEAEVKSAYPLVGVPQLFYRINLGEWIATDMSLTTGNLYMGEIPAPNTVAEIEYYFTAENSNISISLPSSSPQNVYGFSAGSLSSNSFLANNKIKIFPNPSSRFVNIDFGNQDSKITIYTVTGQKILERHTQKRYTFDVSEWKPGIYFAKIDIKGVVYSHKFAVTH